MAALTDKERELVALGASIGAGCQPCTKYHVAAAVKTGLTADEIGRALDEAQAARCAGGVAVANVGRASLGIEAEVVERSPDPADREQALVCIGAAAGCNAAGLLEGFAESAGRQFEFSGEELRSALEMAQTVKEHAADFFRKDAERGLRLGAVTAPEVTSSSQGCGGGPCCQ